MRQADGVRFTLLTERHRQAIRRFVEIESRSTTRSRTHIIDGVPGRAQRRGAFAPGVRAPSGRQSLTPSGGSRLISEPRPRPWCRRDIARRLRRAGGGAPPDAAASRSGDAGPGRRGARQGRAPKTDPPKREGAVDWQGEVIKATGSGAPDMRSLSPAQARLGAEKAAQLDAFRNLIAHRQGHPHLAEQDGGRGDGEGRGEGPRRGRGERLQGGEEAVLQRPGRGDGRRGAAVGHRPGGARPLRAPADALAAKPPRVATPGSWSTRGDSGVHAGPRAAAARRFGQGALRGRDAGPEARKDAVPARYFKSWTRRRTPPRWEARRSWSRRRRRRARTWSSRTPRPVRWSSSPRRSWSRAGWPSSHEERTSRRSAAPVRCRSRRRGSGEASPGGHQGGRGRGGHRRRQRGPRGARGEGGGAAKRGRAGRPACW